MPRHELKQVQRQFRIGLQCMRHAQVHAFAHHAEIRIRKARAPVFELRKQRAVLRLAQFHLAHRRAIEVARVAKIIPHPLGRAGSREVFGGLLLGIEGERVVVAPGAGVQETTQARQEEKRGLDLGSFHIAKARQPAHQLIVAQAARRILDVRLQVIVSIVILLVAFAAEACEVAHQGVALGVQEARQPLGKPGIQRPVAGQVPLIQQADVQLDVLIVYLGAFFRRTHGMADPQPGIPERLQQSRDGLRGIPHQPAAFHQQEQIHVGVGKQVPPAVAAHGEQSQAGRKRRPQPIAGGALHHAVHQCGTLRKRPDGIVTRRRLHDRRSESL